jgi:hypothetical protein
VTDPYRAGSVWWVLIDFGQGRGEQEKFIVLLSDCPANDAKSVGAFTTSQDWHYPGMGTPPCGYPKWQCYRIDPGQEVCFSKPTFVQFDNGFPINRRALGDLAKAGKARYVHTLAEVRFRSILRCATNSVDLEGWAIALIESTVKSLTPATPPAPSPKPRALKPPPFVSSEILSMRVRVETRCGPCRAELAGAMMMAEVAISRVLTGLDQLPAGFLGDLGAGLEALGSDCSSCAKK